MFKIQHTPLTTGEPHDVVGGFDTVEEAKASLQRRARRLLVEYHGCQIQWRDDELGYELTDDEALMIGDYQGQTEIVSE